jgi:hypothetical protein
VINPIGTHNEASVRRQSSGTRAILLVLVRTKEPNARSSEQPRDARAKSVDAGLLSVLNPPPSEYPASEALYQLTTVVALQMESELVSAPSMSAMLATAYP